MRLSVAGAVLLTLTSLAGCIGDGGDADDALGSTDTGAAAAPGVPQLLSSTGCSDQLGLFPVPMEDAAAMLPPGFEPEPFPIDPLGLFAMFYILGASCSDSLVDAGSVGEMREFSGGLLVTPPPELAGDGIDYYSVLFGIWNSNPDVIATLNAWGIDSASAGDVTFEVVDTPAARVATASGSSEGFMVNMRTVIPGPAGSGPDGVIRVFSLEVEDEDEEGDDDEADDEGPEISGAFDLHWTAANYAEGVAQYDENFEVIPMVPFYTEPGLASHTWGDEYAFHAMPVTLPLEEEEDEEEEDDDDRSLFGMRLG